MEKLLHERLREWSPESSSSCVRDMVNGRETFIDDCTYDCPTCASNAAKKLADEIERCYIQRPRFEDGEPVQFGDNIANDHFELGSPVDAFEIRENGFIHIYGNGNSIEFADFEPVQHPTPKVYDADGVPCKPNDEVWSTSKEGIYEEGDMMIVVGIDAGVKERQVLVRRALGGAGEHWVNSKYFTHERPVFDADGVRICMGDTVWHVKGSNPWKVLDVSNKGIKVEDPLCSHDTEVFDASSLTHREPDSLEKLRDIICQCANDAPYKSELEDELLKAVDIATALIERGA